MGLGAMALLMGGAVGAWVALRKWLSSAPAMEPPPRDPGALLRAIVGNDKHAVMAVLGPPRASAGFAAVAPALLVRADFLVADTWYYALDPQARTAIVVRFDSGVAQHAELIRLM